MRWTMEGGVDQGRAWSRKGCGSRKGLDHGRVWIRERLAAGCACPVRLCHSPRGIGVYV